MEKHGEVVQRRADIRMIGTQGPLANGERASVKRFGIGIPHLQVVKDGQLLQRLRHRR